MRSLDSQAQCEFFMYPISTHTIANLFITLLKSEVAIYYKITTSRALIDVRTEQSKRYYSRRWEGS